MRDITAQGGIIRKKYTLHAQQKAFATWMANAGVDRSVVKALPDHSSQNATDEFYIEIDVANLKDEFKKSNF